MPVVNRAIIAGLARAVSPANQPVLAGFLVSENEGMAIGSVYSSALSGMNLAASQLLAGANSVASGNLDNVVQAMQNEQLAQVEFAAAATLLSTQSQMVGSLLDVSA